jgi:thiol:disulfide interchange protein DsbD
MFAFALGLGMPFFVIGTFAVSIPKGGSWMLAVKWFFGVVLAVLALYFLEGVVPALRHAAGPAPAYAIVAVALVGVAVSLAGVHVAAEKPRAAHPGWSKPAKFASIPLAVIGGFVFIAWVQVPKAQLEWLASEAEGVRLAEAEHRPVIVDFGADWCGACKELASKTFADAQVRSEAARFVAVRVDATDEDNAQVSAVKGKYKVVGLPTVVVLDSHGKERARLNEFVPAERFLEIIRAVD